MQPHVTLEGILPATLLHFVEDFLECGTCYKRLQTMIMKRNYKLMFEGFIFKVSFLFISSPTYDGAVYKFQVIISFHLNFEKCLRENYFRVQI